jgi:hypothetical protein
LRDIFSAQERDMLSGRPARTEGDYSAPSASGGAAVIDGISKKLPLFLLSLALRI